jgi:hypothetical protein
VNMESLRLVVLPHVGVGNLRFGKSRREARSLLGQPSEVSRRSAWSRNLTDRYEELWLTLDYSDLDELEFIEIGSGKCSVIIDEVQLMPGRASDVADRLRSRGYILSTIDSGLSVEGVGVSLFIPSTEANAVVEAVSVASKNLGELDISFFGEPGGSRVASWPVEADSGIGGIRFGDLRSEVRQRMGEGMSSSSGAGSRMDHYWAEGLVAKFDAEDHVVEVIALAPAKPTIDGIEVLDKSYGDLRDSLTAAGFGLQEKPAELHIPELNASIWWSRDTREAIPSVAVAVPGSLVRS